MVNNTPISATDEGIEDIKWTFIRTRKPKKNIKAKRKGYSKFFRVFTF